MIMITKKYFNKLSKVLVKFALHFITFSILIFSTQALSYQVSQAQIEQFKKLPPSQQKALAKSMGIDISDFKGQLSGNNSRSELTENTQRYPRGTQFDQQGNPTLNSDEEENSQQVKELKPFGYDVFANSPQTFAPTMDIAIPGIDLKQVKRASLSLKAGGVGYYPQSGFVHVDTGRVRFW